MADQIITINDFQVKLITYGTCHCGCGKPAPITKKSGKGYKKGEPKRFIAGHQYQKMDKSFRWNGGKTKTTHGYIAVYKPDHLRSHQTGYVYEHILKCEEALGKPLPPKSEPHHVNGIKSDNRNCNLVLCEDRSYHLLLHRRTKALEECGHANWKRCWYCGEYDSPENLIERYNLHKVCKNKWQRENYAKRKV